MIDASAFIAAHEAMLSAAGTPNRATVAKVPGIDGSVILDPSRILVIRGRNRAPNAAPVAPTGYVLRSGRWTIDKTEQADLFYGLDVSAALEASRTTVAKVESIVVGVTETVPAFTASPAGIVGIKVAGLDTSGDEAENSVTFLITCANTEVITQTIYFRHKDQ